MLNHAQTEILVFMACLQVSASFGRSIYATNERSANGISNEEMKMAQ